MARRIEVGDEVVVRIEEEFYDGIQLEGEVGYVADENEFEDNYFFVTFEHLTWNNMGHEETVATWLHAKDLSRKSRPA